MKFVTDPITARLNQEMDVLLDDNHIADVHIHCHVFLDHIQNRKKLVQGLGSDGQK